MLADPENSKWASYSVEFCGGTHLRNTKDAVCFALYEETAVAKGIRRVSAYTGEAATSSDVAACAIQQQMDDMKNLEGNALVDAVALVKAPLSSSSISLSKKNAMRKQLEGLVDKVRLFQKKEAAERMARGVQDVKAAACSAKESDSKFVVVSLQVGTDAKLGRDMLEAMTKAHPLGSFCILSRDMVKNKTACYCQTHADSNIDARNWTSAAMAPMKGKGGGKDSFNASGQAKTIEGIDAAVVAANTFVTNV